MKGIDTNILVRLLTKDDEFQAKKVYNIFKKTEIDDEELFVSLLVVLELIWVLDSVYHILRVDILDSLADLLLMPILKFECQSLLHTFILKSRENNYDLADLLIAYSGKAQGCETIITFDKKASKSNLFELV